MRVIGSHAISTSWLPSGPEPTCCAEVCGGFSVAVIRRPYWWWTGLRWQSVAAARRLPGAACTRRELGPLAAPLGLLVDGAAGDLTQPAHRRAVHTDRCGRELAAGRLIHERH